MNYRELLKKYMLHVMAAEGVSFLDHGSPIHSGDVDLSEEDMKALREIEAEADATWSQVK